MYLVGFNMPGYMPTSEPYKTYHLSRAVDAVISEMQYTLESIVPENEHDDEAHDERRALNEEILRLTFNPPKGEYSCTIGNWVYWIAEA